MKRFALLIMLTLAATFAWAGNNYLGSTVSSGAGVITPPSGASAGFAVVNQNAVKGFQVTVSDVRDGSVGDTLDDVLTADAYAWCYQARLLAPDGGGGWERLQTLDVSMRMSDAGTGVVSTGKFSGLTGLATTSTTAGIDCSRIAYTADGLNLSYDAGTLVYRVSITEQD